MNVGYISSNAYAPYVGTSMYSLFDHNKNVETIHVYIVDDGINGENKQKIKSIAHAFKREVRFLSCEKVMRWLKEEKGFNPAQHKKFPNSVYAIALPEFFYENDIELLDRLLMIDGDIIINHDLSDLYNTNIDNVYVAAVPEITAYYVSSECEEIIYKKKYYYNCGMTLWNLRKVREDHFSQRVLETYENYPEPFKLASQSLLNLTLADADIRSLPLKYNYNTALHINVALREPVYRRYAEGGLGYPSLSYKWPLSANKIYMIHYIAARKPWIKWRLAPLRSYFLKYWKKGPWRDMPRESYLDDLIAFKLRKNPNAFVGKGILGRVYAALLIVIERYFPNTRKKLVEIKNKVLKLYK